jgi:multiple sugar transport system permease protein
MEKMYNQKYKRVYSLRQKTRIATNLSLIPMIVILIATFLIPLGIAIYISSKNYDLSMGTNQFNYFKNYVKIFSDSSFFRAIGRNIIYVAITVSANFILGLIMALVVNTKFKGANVLSGILILPMILMPTAAAVLWRFLYNETFGLVNHILALFGFQGTAWLASGKTALYGVILTDIWAWTPWMFLVLLAGLKSIPTEPTEAARIDGATSFSLFRYITLPLLKPVILIALTLKTIDTFKAFDYLWIMTMGGPGESSHIISTYIYWKTFTKLNFGYGSAMSIFSLLIIIIISVIYIYIIRKQEAVK